MVVIAELEALDPAHRAGRDVDLIDLAELLDLAAEEHRPVLPAHAVIEDALRSLQLLTAHLQLAVVGVEVPLTGA